MTSLNDLISVFNQKKGYRDRLVKDLDQVSIAISASYSYMVDSEKAQIIMQKVAKETQESIKFHVEDLVTTAIESVFPETYKFLLEFEIKRNRTEINILLLKNGEKVSPMDSSGGGLIDVISFALRLSLWSLYKGKKQSIMILDEPFKFLSRDLQDKAGQMLKQLSSMLGIQVIMVTHIPDLIRNADMVFDLSN